MTTYLDAEALIAYLLQSEQSFDNAVNLALAAGKTGAADRGKVGGAVVQQIRLSLDSFVVVPVEVEGEDQ